MDTELVLLIPVGLGTFITALIGIGKYFGWVPEDTGGKVSLVLNLLAGSALYIAAGVFEVDVEGEQAKLVFEILGLVGALLLQYLGSMVSHYTSVVAKLYTPRGNRR
jgi:hypothetical protein